MVVAQLDVGDYGRYAMAFAASGIFVGVIDNPFLVRSIRISERAFERERRVRTSFSVGLILAGLSLIQVNYIIGFAIVIAGGEIALNALKSHSVRGGLVDRVMLMDLVRQALSIAVGGAYLVLSADPSVEMASLLYAGAYLGAVLVAALRYGFALPRLPGKARESILLSFGALAGAGYAQGDVLVLGIVAGEEAAGTYSIASLIAWSAAGLFLNHANTHVRELRAGGPGARLVRVVPPAIGIGSIVLLSGLLLTWLGVMDPLGPTLTVLSLFVVLRAINHVCTVALTVARKDVTRTLATVATTLVDFCLVLVFVSQGSIGAAVAAVISEALLCLVYLRAHKNVSAYIGSRTREIV